MGIVAFLPARQGSERVPNKNTRPFAMFDHGLIDVKLKQLTAATLIDSIVLSTNDPAIIDLAENYRILHGAEITIHQRDESLCANDTSTDNLIIHAGELINDGHILWTHCTSPFVTAAFYDEMIKRYYTRDSYDSLMTVTRIQSFLWAPGNHMNFDRGKTKWPRTQTLDPVYRVTSGAFIAPADMYKSGGDRIGSNPLPYVVDEIVGLDIDTEADFKLAECLYWGGCAEI